jgi:hypothetical protein
LFEEKIRTEGEVGLPYNHPPAKEEDSHCISLCDATCTMRGNINNLDSKSFPNSIA